MKYFIAVTLIATVASAAVLRPLRSELAEIQEIIAAIQSPSTDPATAAALEQMLLDVLNPEPVAVGPAIIEYEPIAVGPAIIESEYEPIAVGPAVVDFPLPDGGAVAEEPTIIPSPVSIVEATPTEIASGTPLVQIILNTNQAAAEYSPISVGPAVAPEFVEIKPEPVHVVESAPEPVQVVEVALEPVQVVEVAPEPVQIVEVAPAIPVHPIGIVTPVAVGPANIESEYEPIAVGPAIIESVFEPIAVGPAVVDFPLPDGGAVAEEPTIIPSPVSIVEATSTEIASGTPLVQIILNTNQAAAESSPISVGPAVAPEFVEIKPEPVHVVESAPEPVQVVDVAPEPVQVVEVAPVVPVHPIGIVTPVAVEPVQIGVPVIPEAAVVLPEELN